VEFHPKLSKEKQIISYKDFKTNNEGNKQRKEDLLNQHFKLGSNRDKITSNSRLHYEKKKASSEQSKSKIGNKAMNEVPNFSIKNRLMH